MVTAPSIGFSAQPDGVHAANSLRSDRFHIRGLSWFGAEGAGAAPDGLWQRKASDLIGIVARLGFNALRLPLAVDHVLSNPSINRWTLTANPELQRLRHLDLLERIVRLAAAQGLLVMLDMHRLRASVWPTTHGLWYDEGMPATQLESAWRRLARTFCSHWNVFAADLFNEPWGASWGDGDQERDWALYAGRLGSLVLEECPRWLILVEGLGVGSSAPSPAFCDLCFWGENFLNVTGAGVPRLSKPERLVLSPHLYGPGTNSRMYYFNRTVFPNFPDNMGPIWTDHFLAPARAARAALLVGEWGGRYVGDDELWQDRFKAFLLENSLSSFYWALNPNSGDTGGILLEDWTAPHVEKQQMLSELPASSVAQALASVGPFECLKHVGAAQVPAALGGIANGLFRCGDARNGTPICLHAQQACNGVYECPDHTDERRGACASRAAYEAAIAVGTADKESGNEASGGGGGGDGGPPVAPEVEPLSPPCLTVAGQDVLRPCVLPFTYRGARFTGCSLDDAIDGRAWCPTAVDASGRYSSFDRWGVCGPGCAKETGRRLHRDGCSHVQRQAEGHEEGQAEGQAEGPAEGAELLKHCAPPPSPPPTPPEPPAAPPPPPPASLAALGATTVWAALGVTTAALILMSVVVGLCTRSLFHSAWAAIWADLGRPSELQLEEEEDDVEEAEERRPVRASPSVHEKRTGAGAREDTDEEDAVLLKGRAQQTSRPLAMAMDGMD